MVLSEPLLIEFINIFDDDTFQAHLKVISVSQVSDGITIVEFTA
jgi:hypothetical protein